MISYIKFRKKEKKLTAGLFLVLSSLGVSAYSAGTNQPAANAIPNLSNIVVVAPKHSGEEGAPFYANNVQLEPLDVYFCFDSTPPPSLSMSDMSFYTMKGGSGEGSKHVVKLNTDTANDQGFFLYDNTSDYYKMYTSMGFTMDGGVYVGKRYQLQGVNGTYGDGGNTPGSGGKTPPTGGGDTPAGGSDTPADGGDTPGGGGDTSACSGKNFIEKSLFIRAKQKPGVFNFLITAKNDAGDTISSDASANNYVTMPPLQYSKTYFNFYIKDFGKQNELIYKRTPNSAKGGAESAYKRQQDGNQDYLFNFDPENGDNWQQVRYNSAGNPHKGDKNVYFTRSPINGSAFDKLTLNMVNGDNGKTKAHGLHTWWGLLTGMQTDGLYAPPLISVAPQHASVASTGQAGNLLCYEHTTTNHWSVQYLWNVSKVLESQSKGGYYKQGVYKYETLTGGIGLPADTVGDPSMFWIQTIMNHYNNGSQHKYGCDARDHVTLIGYDTYGNEFLMKMLPRIGKSGAEIDYIQTVNPYDRYRPTP